MWPSDTIQVSYVAPCKKLIAHPWIRGTLVFVVYQWRILSHLVSAVCFRLDLCLSLWLSHCGGPAWWRSHTAVLQLFHFSLSDSLLYTAQHNQALLFPLSTIIMSLLLSVIGVKVEHLKWLPTSTLYFSKSGLWMYLILSSIFQSEQHDKQQKTARLFMLRAAFLELTSSTDIAELQSYAPWRLLPW